MARVHEPEHERIETAGGGLSRRQVLARGAVAAGVVWAAPVIRTATAYATSAAGTERPCTKFYLVCLDLAGPRPVRFEDPEFEYDEMPTASVLARFRPGGDPLPSTTTTSSTTTSTTTSSTSSTTTTSTSTTTTSPTTTTTTTRPFRDPTEGLGLFPGDEASADPRGTKKQTKKRDKNKAKDRDERPAESDTDELAAAAGIVDADDAAAIDPADDLGLFPEEPDPNAVAEAAVAAPTADLLPPGIEQWLRDNPDVPLRYPEIPPMLTQTGEQAWAVLIPEVEGGPNPLTHQCRSVKGWSQVGKAHAEFYVDPNPALPIEEGRRIIFPNPRFEGTKPERIERVFLVYCCP